MEAVLDTVLRGVLAIGAIILLTRLQGLRSFSKLSSFDFSLTVAFGSFIAGFSLAPDTPLEVGLAGIGTVFAVQTIIGFLRQRVTIAQRLTDNVPLLLMRDGEIDEGALRTARMTKGDLMAKLREANALSLDRVRAVVMETTGDVSVLHGEPGQSGDIEHLLEGVRQQEL